MIRLLILSLLSISLVACIGGVSTPTQFYSLNSHYQIKDSDMSTRSSAVSVGIGPISLPDYFNRPQIVTREGQSKIRVAEFHHWAGNMKDNIMNLLRGELIQNLDSNRVFMYPWPRVEKPQYKIRIDVIDFSGSLGKSLKFTGTWSISYSNARNHSDIYSFSFQKQLGDDSYETLVKSMSELVVSLSQQMVNTLKKMEKQKRMIGRAG